MKRIILSMTMLLTIGVGAALATEAPEYNPKAVETFKKEFSSAENAKWSSEEGYSKVSFVLGGTRAIAVFNEQGELLGSMRDLLYNQLPLSVITALDKKYPGKAVFDIREVINQDGTRYRFTLENRGKKYSVTVFPDGNVAEVKKIKA